MNIRKSKLLVISAFSLTLLLIAHAARVPTVGSDSGTWGTVLNDFLSVEHTANGTHRNVTIEGDLIVNGSVLYVNGTSGNVGIGTTGPTSQLQIEAQGLSQETNIIGSQTGLLLRSQTADSRTWLALAPKGTSQLSDLLLYNTEDISTNYENLQLGYAFPTFNGFEIVTTKGGNGTQRPLVIDATGVGYPNWNQLYLATSGNVGIGTTTPSARLDVAGNTTADLLSITNSGTAATIFRGRRSRGTASVPTDIQNGDEILRIAGNGYSGGSYLGSPNIAFEVDGTFTSGQAPPSRITFLTNPANSSNSERMRITSGGNVGINTTTPQSTLQVDGSVNLSNVVYVQNNGNVGIGTTTPARLLHLQSANPEIQFNDTTTGKNWHIGSVSDNLFGITETGVDQRLVIQNGSGNVGIGTTGPTFRLHAQTPVSTASNIFRAGIAAGNSFDITSDVGNGLYLNFASVLYAASTGNVGIGTTTPSARLHVAGNVSLTGNITMLSSDGTVWDCGVNNSGAFVCT